MNLSKKANLLSPSLTLEITAKAKSMKDAGINVVSFGAGEPDFDTPENIQKAGIDAITKGLTRYTPTAGIPQLKEAICNSLKKDLGLEYAKEEILISSGAKHSIFNVLAALLNPGDEVLFAVPYWVSYPEMVKLADGVPVPVVTTEENGFKLTPEILECNRNSKTKVLIINSPNNPTGSVYTKEELQAIADWCVEKNIFIISDEIYSKLIYGNIEHVSIATLGEEVRKRTIIINGVSKAYAMTGWRIGYLAADKKIVKLINNIQSHMTSNPCSISQYASVEALNGPQDSLKEMNKHFEERRNYMVDRINQIPNLYCRKPEGAFYVMISLKNVIGKTYNGNIIKGSMDFTNLLLEEEKVAVVPGIAFGVDDYIRLSYAASMENIKEGLDRIERLMKRF